MTTQYAEEQGFKKKYLAPLIVLMLCAVSLTGAAYAYSTSVTGHGDIDHDYISIDMYDSAGAVISEDIKSTAFKAYSNIDRTADGDKKLHTFVEDGQLVYTTYVKVTTDITGAKFTLETTAKYTAPDKGGKLVMDKDYTTAQTLTSEIKVYLASDDPETAVAVDELDGNELYRVVITIDIGSSSVEFGTYDNLAAFQAAINAFDNEDKAGFTFKFVASQTTA